VDLARKLRMAEWFQNKFEKNQDINGRP
jgi:hypothetical protein